MMGKTMTYSRLRLQVLAGCAVLALGMLQGCSVMDPLYRLENGSLSVTLDWNSIQDDPLFMTSLLFRADNSLVEERQVSSKAEVLYEDIEEGYYNSVFYNHDIDSLVTRDEGRFALKLGSQGSATDYGYTMPLLDEAPEVYYAYGGNLQVVAGEHRRDTLEVSLYRRRINVVVTLTGETEDNRISQVEGVITGLSSALNLSTMEADHVDNGVMAFVCTESHSTAGHVFSHSMKTLGWNPRVSSEYDVIKEMKIYLTDRQGTRTPIAVESVNNTFNMAPTAESVTLSLTIGLPSMSVSINTWQTDVFDEDIMQ